MTPEPSQAPACWLMPAGCRQLPKYPHHPGDTHGSQSYKCSRASSQTFQEPVQGNTYASRVTRTTPRAAANRYREAASSARAALLGWSSHS